MKKTLLKHLSYVMAASILFTSLDMTLLAAGADPHAISGIEDVSGNDISAGDKLKDDSEAMGTMPGEDEYAVKEIIEEAAEEVSAEPVYMTELTPEESISGGEVERTIRNISSEDGEDTHAGEDTHTGEDEEGVTSEKLSVVINKYEKCYYDASGETEELNGFVYTGKAVKPAVTVYYDGIKLKSGTDYTVSYKNNVDANPGFCPSSMSYVLGEQDPADQPAILITGKGKYAGLTKEENFIIFKKVLSRYAYELTITNLTTNMVIDRTKDQEYPVPTVKYGKTSLIYGRDFDIQITGFTDQDNREEAMEENLTSIPAGYYGTGTIALRLFGNYSNGYDRYGWEGEKTAEPDNIKIGTLNVSNTTEKSLKDAKVVAGAGAKKIMVERTGAGRCTYSVNFGVYDESSKQYYLVKDGKVTDTVVKAKDIYTVYLINEDGSRTYLVYGKDFDIKKRNTNTTNKNLKPSFDIIGMGDYVGVIAGNKVTLQRQKLNAKQVVWNNFVSGFTYTGTAIRQEMDREPDGNHDESNYYYYGIQCGDVMLYDIADFTVTYKNNVNAGTASVTITMLPESGYTGSFTRKFKISKVDISKADVKISVGNLFVSAKNPEITIDMKYNGYTQDKSNYKVSYKKNKKDMTMTVTVKGAKNFTGSVTQTFPLASSTLTEKMFSVTNEKGTLIGRKELQFQAVTRLATSSKNGTLTYEDYELVKGKDFDVTYKVDAKNSRMMVTVKGKGSFSGSFTKEYAMEYPALTESMFSIEKTVDYDPAGAKASVAGTYKGIVLKEGTDYTLTYKDNKAVGKATVVITGKGNFSGSITKSFEIKAVPFELCNVEIDRIQYQYDKEVYEPNVKVTYNNKTLKDGTDYTVTYTNNTKADYKANIEGYVTVTPKGNFEGDAVIGKIDFYHRVVNDMTICIVLREGTNYYNGEQVRPELEEVWHTNGLTHYTITEGKDYVVEGYGNNNKVGNSKGTITIKGINYYGGTATIKFDILEEDVYTKTSYSNIKDGETVLIDEIVEMANSERKKQGLMPLVITDKIQQIARQRARQSGTDFTHKYAITDGECLAYGGYKMSLDHLYQAWYDSIGHRKQMLMKDAKVAACAVYRKGDEYYYCFVCSEEPIEKEIAKYNPDDYVLIYTNPKTGVEYWITKEEYDYYIRNGIDPASTVIDDPDLYDELKKKAEDADNSSMQ